MSDVTNCAAMSPKICCTFTKPRRSKCFTTYLPCSSALPNCLKNPVNLFITQRTVPSIKEEYFGFWSKRMATPRIGAPFPGRVARA